MTIYGLWFEMCSNMISPPFLHQNSPLLNPEISNDGLFLEEWHEISRISEMCVLTSRISSTSLPPTSTPVECIPSHITSTREMEVQLV